MDKGRREGVDNNEIYDIIIHGRLKNETLWRMFMSQIPPNLNKWIQRKLNTYKEKPRKGTPKGEPYGIPKQKYHAALLHLAYTRTFSLREIARHAGVSYSLLANWRGEDRFKDLIGRATAEYSHKLLDSVILGDYDRDWNSVFTEQELPKYSLFLIYRILDDVFLMYKSQLEKVRQSDDLLMKNWKPLSKVYGFFFSVVEAGVNTWGKRDRRIMFYEGRAKRSSQLLELIGKAFKLALKNDLKDDAVEIFDMVSHIAEATIMEASNLRKELIKREPDAAIQDAT